MGLLDNIGDLIGVEGFLIGGLIGLGILLFTFLLLSTFEVPAPVQILAAIAEAGVFIVIGLWPSWLVIVLAVFGGALIASLIMDRGSSSSA